MLRRAKGPHWSAYLFDNDFARTSMCIVSQLTLRTWLQHFCAGLQKLMAFSAFLTGMSSVLLMHLVFSVVNLNLLRHRRFQRSPMHVRADSEANCLRLADGMALGRGLPSGAGRRFRGRPLSGRLKTWPGNKSANHSTMAVAGLGPSMGGVACIVATEREG